MIENPHTNQPRPTIMAAVMNATIGSMLFYKALQIGDGENLRADMYTTKTRMAQTNSLSLWIK